MIADIPDLSSADPMSPWAGGTPAEQELRWHYCQAGGELGERSAWDSLVFMAQVGGHSGIALEQMSASLGTDPVVELEGIATCPRPPASRIAAAARDSRIRQALRTLTPVDQAVLEVRYSERRPDAQLKGLLGDDADLEPVVAYVVSTGQVKLKMDGTGDELAKVVALARGLLTGALARYEQARGLGSAEVTKKLDRAAKGRRVGILQQAGSKGASKRRLSFVEAPRRGKQ